MITDKGKKKLLAFHGLDPEKHNDDDVDNAINNSVTPDDLDDLQNRAETAEAQLIDADLAKYAPKIGKDEKVVARWKEALVNNRAATIEMLDALPEPVAVKSPNADKKPIHNRATAGTPEAIDQADAAKAQERTKKDALIKNRASKLQESGMPMTAAHVQANKEIDEELAAGMHK